MVNFQDITLTSFETITGFGLTDGAFLFMADELQNGSIANTEEKVDITGKAGRKISSLKRNKAVTVTATNGMVSGGILELQTGGQFENGTAYVQWIDYLTVDEDHKAITTWKATGTAGAEITHLYLKNEDGIAVTALEQAAEAAAGKFKYTVADKELQFHTDVAAGTEVVVFYERKITANVLANDSDKYSGKCRAYIDAMGEDKCGNIYRVQIYIPKADFSGEFTIDLGDNQTVHNFELEALAGGCGSGSKFWTWTIFADDEEDAA